LGSHDLDPKTRELVKKIVKIDYTKTSSEAEALILESEMIKRYRPRYNIAWKDDKNFIYIKITEEDYPQVVLVRQIVEDRAKYLGPFVDVASVKGLLKYLRKIFMFRHCANMPDRVCLQYSIGNCTGPCQNFINKREYNKNIKNIIKFFEGKTGELQKSFEKEMKKAASIENFEKAAVFRNRITWIKKVNSLNLISFQDTNLKNDQALRGLRDQLNLVSLPHRIECYDISNIFGKVAVGSMVVFEDGIPKKDDYRRFEIKAVQKIDDYQMIREVLARRFKRIIDIKDSSFASIPDLIIIDGGKGHLSSALTIMEEIGIKSTIVALAKKREEIFKRSIRNGARFDRIILKPSSESLYLVQRIRDEAHRFAITYHRSKRGKEMSFSSLDIVPGVGPVTKKKLIKKFGSVELIRKASLESLGREVGEKLAKKIKENL